MDYSRSTVRAYFAGLTPDSRPMCNGTCPVQQALGLEFTSDATRLDPVLVNRIDRSVKAAYGSSLNWSLMTAQDVLTVIDGIPS